MSWQPPGADTVTVLKWLGLAGLFAAMVNILRQFVSGSSRLSWWQKIFSGLLVGSLSIGVSSMMIAVWPNVNFFVLLGLASMSGYLGADFIMWLAYRIIGGQRWDDRRGRDENNETSSS